MTASKGKFFEILSLNREDNKWDFKQDIHLKPAEKFYELLKDILAFSNSGGGHLLLGIKNKSNEIVGVSEIIDEANLGQKIYTALGYSINVELNYFKYNKEGNEVDLGILYIPNSNKICISPKTFSVGSKTIIQSDIVFVRRNTSSIYANSEDLQELAYKIVSKGKYIFSDKDKKIIERNKDYARNLVYFDNYLEGKYKFSSINFAAKLNEIFNHQVQHNKLEFAILLGLDEDRIDDYFEGLAVPKLEHILRAIEIFKLPMDFFFQPTINMRKPLWYSPMVSYCIIEKVENKRKLFNIDNSKFFKEVFFDLGKSLVRFFEWLDSERMVKPNDELDLMFSSYNYLDDHVITLTDSELLEYKKHLMNQFYKLREIYRSLVSRDNELFPDEEMILYLVGSNDEFICRILNESIKSIVVYDSENIKINYNFFYELENLLKISKRYNLDNVSLEISKEETVK
ncbi:ATP-binding protein [Bacillus toyonensis]|uniref:ATP-binding protein n=1 Tax=Bacillus toyonensis TaxID=155322 RepID=UPI000BF20551|nr:ATP-binding protein [Bacillus toyonensis]PEM90666.1 ATP-binding protein [Bacillus toyonensis]